VSDNGPVLYGNWRKKRGIGIGNLSSAQSVVLAVCALAVVASMSITPRVALIAVAFAAVVAVVVLVPVGNHSLAEWATGVARSTRANSIGETRYDGAGGLVSDHPRANDLPGPMAPQVPLTVPDGRGGWMTLLWDRLTGRLTAILRVAPVGLDLADLAQVDMWVATFGALMAELGYIPMVRWMSVTVDTAPSGGTTVRDYVTARVDPQAPAGARQVMAELVEASPTQSADADAWVAIVCDPALAHPRPTSLLDAVAEVTRILPTIETRLSGCGVTVMGRADIAWLTRRLRVAYDPAAAGASAPGRAEIAQMDELAWWADAGPVAAQEEWSHWRHDSGMSVTWAWEQAPRQPVPSRILIPLLAPGRWPRRVTMLYTPTPAGKAADVVEREVSASSIRRALAARTRREPTQRDITDAARATQAAQEEAAGAGVVTFTLYASVTVTDPAQLATAVADTEQRAGQCQIRLRRQTRGHAGGFAAALGMGTNPAAQAPGLAAALTRRPQ
jgi:hypothetical protein